jgi:hypothetical protein
MNIGENGAGSTSFSWLAKNAGGHERLFDEFPTIA